MGVRRGLLLAVAALAVPGMVVVGAAAPAAAQDEADDGPPLRGWFVRDSLIYPNTPDGWACHFLGQCRPPGARTDDGPGPIAVVGYGQNVELICQFGSYAKITTAAAGHPAPTTTPASPPAARTPPPPTRTPRATPPAPAGPAPATTSPRPTGSHTPASSPPAIPYRSAGAATPTPSRSAQAAPLTVTGGPAEITEPVSGWAPVADIATAPELRAARCTVDQWAW